MENVLGTHGMVWTSEWTHEAWELAFQRAARAGFGLMEVPLIKPSAVDAELFKRLFLEYTMQATGSVCLTSHTDVSSEDLKIVAKGEDFLRSAVDVMHAIGGTLIGGVMYSAVQKYSGPPTRQGWNNSVRSTQALADYSKERGITIAVEIANRFETNLINTSAQAMRYLDEVDRDNVFVHIDTFHQNIEEGRPGAAVRLCGDRVGYVHVGECHRGYLGTGGVDFDDLFLALEDIRYTGPIVFESFSSTVTSPDLSAALGIWRNMWDDCEDVATHASSFIMQKIIAARQRKWVASH